MTVAQLIEQLKKLPQDKHVFVWDFGLGDITSEIELELRDDHALDWQGVVIQPKEQG